MPRRLPPAASAIRVDSSGNFHGLVDRNGRFTLVNAPAATSGPSAPGSGRRGK